MSILVNSKYRSISHSSHPTPSKVTWNTKRRKKHTKNRDILSIFFLFYLVFFSPFVNWKFTLSVNISSVLLKSQKPGSIFHLLVVNIRYPFFKWFLFTKSVVLLFGVNVIGLNK